MTLWCLDALLSVGAIGRGYATSLGELGSHPHGRGGDKRGGFVVKTEQKETGGACTYTFIRYIISTTVLFISS